MSGGWRPGPCRVSICLQQGVVLALGGFSRTPDDRTEAPVFVVRQEPLHVGTRIGAVKTQAPYLDQGEDVDRTWVVGFAR